MGDMIWLKSICLEEEEWFWNFSEHPYPQNCIILQRKLGKGIYPYEESQPRVRISLTPLPKELLQGFVQPLGIAGCAWKRPRGRDWNGGHCGFHCAGAGKNKWLRGKWQGWDPGGKEKHSCRNVVGLLSLLCGKVLKAREYVLQWLARGISWGYAPKISCVPLELSGDSWGTWRLHYVWVLFAQTPDEC